MKENIQYHLLYAALWPLSKLPLRVLYCISDVLYLLVYYVVRYRRSLVRQNLTSSFPDMSAEEVMKTEKEFYAFFCDYMVETLKLLTISESEIRRRMRFEGCDMLMRYIREGRSAAIYMGHCCNWEWVTSLALWLGPEATCMQIFHPLENDAANRLFKHIRSRFGHYNVAMIDTLRQIIRHRNAGQHMVIGFIADQTPLWSNIHYWTEFLNHPKTPVFTGTERIVRRCDFVVATMTLRRERRGYYVAKFELLTDAPNSLPENEITERATRTLEAAIRRQPPYWLWSHNRWKRTYEQWLRMKAEHNPRVRNS